MTTSTIRMLVRTQQKVRASTGARLFIFLCCALFIIFTGISSAYADSSEFSNNRCNTQRSDFQKFFIHFSESVQIQKKSIQIPFTESYLDSDELTKLTFKSRQKILSEIDFPVIPNRDIRSQRNYEIKIDPCKFHTAEVTLFKQDTDFKVIYFFEKKKKWILVSTQNWSL
jgi:hypothetical protein